MLDTALDNDSAADVSISDSQVRSMMITGSQEGLPNLVVKRDEGDILRDLSQPINRDDNEQQSSQGSLVLFIREQMNGEELPVDDEAARLASAAFDSDHILRLPIAVKREPRDSVTPENPPLLPEKLEHKYVSVTDVTLTSSLCEISATSGVVFNADTSWAPSPPAAFYVNVPLQRKNSKNIDYLMAGGTLFAKNDIKVPFSLAIPAGYAENGAQLRIFAQYEDPTHKGVAVERCPNHLNQDHTPLRKYFVQTDDKYDHVDYGDSSRMYAITMPAMDSINLKFTCFTSCSGGIARRPVILVFELSGYALEPLSYSFPMRACANPFRDAKKEKPAFLEEALAMPGVLNAPPVQRQPRTSFDNKSKDSTASSPVSQFRKRSNRIEPGISDAKRARTSEDDEKVYTVQVFGYRKYRELMRYVETMEKAERYSEMRKAEKSGRPVVNDCLSQVTYDTSVENWLAQYSLAAYAGPLDNRGITTLGDLSEHFTEELFASLGIPPPDAVDLNRAFLNWRNVYECGLVLSDNFC